MTSLTAVVPWRDHGEFARGFWKAISIAGQLDVLVIDNGSNPPLPNAYRLDVNAGFSRACNVGLELARTDAIVFLNNDIEATREGWADRIREALEPDVLVGTCLRNNPHGDVDGHMLPYLDGWCLAGMRDDLLYLGGWDEAYQEPAYFGDNDLCLRARSEGMRLKEVDTGLIHLSNGTSDDDPPARHAASMANRERFRAVARAILQPEKAAA